MRNKSDLYEQQQTDVIDKIIHILNLDDTGSITLYDLEKDEEKTNAIMKLLPDIRTYFAFGQIMGAKDPDKVKRPWLSIIKSLTKTQYRLFKSDFRIPKDDGVIRTKKYTFVKIE